MKSTVNDYTCKMIHLYNFQTAHPRVEDTNTVTDASERAVPGVLSVLFIMSRLLNRSRQP